jgi:hypothetical protein
VLQAVRQLNPATQAVLNSGCKPVEVNGEEIVVTFPFAFLREKLGDPQRRAEIQDALAEVLHVNCRLRLVLASDYAPRQQVPRANPTAVREQSAPAFAAGGVPDPISEWAEKRGGQAKFIQP